MSRDHKPEHISNALASAASAIRAEAKTSLHDLFLIRVLGVLFVFGSRIRLPPVAGPENPV
jgi:hypothetical protein